MLPGAYMGRENEPGKPQSNPGFSYIRVALVSDLSTIMTALERVEILWMAGRGLRRSRPAAHGGCRSPDGRRGKHGRVGWPAASITPRAAAR